MKKLYFTLTGCNHYYGTDFLECGMKVKLSKEPDNVFDSEAIQVKMKGLGLVGYVANSTFSVKGESMSAGRLYDKIGKKAKAEIVYVIPGGAICKITEDGIKEQMREKTQIKVHSESPVESEKNTDQDKWSC